MERLIYFSVRLIAAVYMLYKIWMWLFRGAAAKHIWNKIPVRNPREKPEPESRRSAIPVVGATKTVILEDPEQGQPTIVASTDLELTGYIGRDEDISADDVESDYRPSDRVIPSDEDLYDEPHAGSYDPELAGGGVTFEQIGEAINVLTGTGTVDEAVKSRARDTLIELQHTAILEMITREVCDEQTLEQFINDGDTAGKAEKPEDVRIKDFDMTIYV